MQLTCPNCGARYRIDASGWPTEAGPYAANADDEPVFRPRRARCKVCRSVWAAIPEEEVLELDDPLPPDEEHPRLGDAAWSAVGGWPDPRPLIPPPAPQPDFQPPLDRPPPVFTPSGFTPPKDPAATIYAAPPKPAIHFEGPPVPVALGGQPAVRARLPGPGAGLSLSQGAALSTPVLDPAPSPAEPEPENWPDEAYDDYDGEEEAPRRIWPWLLAVLLIAGLVVLALLWTGRLKAEDYGLPPFDPTVIGLPGVQMTAVSLPNVSLPSVSVPQVRLPRTPPPPLAVEASVVRRTLPGNRIVWEIEGTVLNPTAKSVAVPPVEMRLLDKGGRAVARWTVRPDATTVAAGQRIRFETSAIDPPADAVKLNMQLKPAELGRL